ncbi:Hpt domain-containing protein [Hahella sp. CCB-MM4]|uniref:Hpt domain-containing protein n=1 Tax=Hahella sp. (strain CCB-MM4) TaxID=1926491 RepID=UPI000B9B2364|nr:Hpt domain-containing protein [Hahella sp. CCB-MM4]OZG72885.1 Hpt domain-containing protein [Hahella sp. CCB-MM4]
MTTETHLDDAILSDLKEMMEGEFEFLVTTFIDDSKQRLEDIQSYLETDNPAEFGRACHSLKGSATNLGLPNLSDLCRQGEEMGYGGQLNQAVELVDQIKTEFDQVSVLLKDYI